MRAADGECVSSGFTGESVGRVEGDRVVGKGVGRGARAGVGFGVGFGVGLLSFGIFPLLC
jgi:hypothetical protein